MTTTFTPTDSYAASPTQLCGAAHVDPHVNIVCGEPAGHDRIQFMGYYYDHANFTVPSGAVWDVPKPLGYDSRQWRAMSLETAAMLVEQSINNWDRQGWTQDDGERHIKELRRIADSLRRQADRMSRPPQRKAGR